MKMNLITFTFGEIEVHLAGDREGGAASSASLR
jgi:hypothetical protein